MYEDSLTEVEYDNMEEMPYMGERHFQYAGISDPRHMRRLLASVEQMVGWQQIEGILEFALHTYVFVGS